MAERLEEAVAVSLTPLGDAYILFAGMSSTLFGEQLKRERELRGVSLPEISAATRISTRFLEAIENDQWDQLPGGVFNRGFIRSIARYLGLDEDSLVAEYALGLTTSVENRTVTQRPRQIPRNWTPTVVLMVVVLTIIALGALGCYRYRVWISDHLLRRAGDLSPRGEISQ